MYLVGVILNKYKIFFADEMRFGLVTNKKRSWSKVGERTRLPNQMEYKNRYLYSAIAPYTHNIIIWDNALFHKPKVLYTKKIYPFANYHLMARIKSNRKDYFGRILEKLPAE